MATTLIGPKGEYYSPVLAQRDLEGHGMLAAQMSLEAELNNALDQLAEVLQCVRAPLYGALENIGAMRTGFFGSEPLDIVRDYPKSPACGPGLRGRLLDQIDTLVALAEHIHGLAITLDKESCNLVDRLLVPNTAAKSR